MNQVGQVVTRKVAARAELQIAVSEIRYNWMCHREAKMQLAAVQFHQQLLNSQQVPNVQSHTHASTPSDKAEAERQSD